MPYVIDDTDRRILHAVQRDASLSMDALAEQAGLSRNACWRRLRQMEAAGVIRDRVTRLNPAAVGLGLMVFVLVRTNRHDAAWLEEFQRAVTTIPEVLGAFRMTGDLDYVIRLRVRNVADYDRVYKTLISRVDVSDISASFVMEELKDVTALPV
ncbi:Lrp/AsnC family transcriptional regulator [Pseudaestuariivita sp.]|uniref:Lrp/AsnC family transcriptional regulator n=1 Tax=Pseudaestuariivita sp. TaxID=2211669 RepID=UPI0040589CA8